MVANRFDGGIAGDVLLDIALELNIVGYLENPKKPKF